MPGRIQLYKRNNFHKKRSFNFFESICATVALKVSYFISSQSVCYCWVYTFYCELKGFSCLYYSLMQSHDWSARLCCLCAGLTDGLPEGQRSDVERTMSHRSDHGSRTGLLALWLPWTQRWPQTGHCTQVWNIQLSKNHCGSWIYWIDTWSISCLTCCSRTIWLSFCCRNTKDFFHTVDVNGVQCCFGLHWLTLYRHKLLKQSSKYLCLWSIWAVFTYLILYYMCTGILRARMCCWRQTWQPV